MCQPNFKTLLYCLPQWSCVAFIKMSTCELWMLGKVGAGFASFTVPKEINCTLLPKIFNTFYNDSKLNDPQKQEIMIVM